MTSCVNTGVVIQVQIPIPVDFGRDGWDWVRIGRHTGTGAIDANKPRPAAFSANSGADSGVPSQCFFAAVRLEALGNEGSRRVQLARYAAGVAVRSPVEGAPQGLNTLAGCFR
jgi:hypothetical protein